MSKTYFIPFTEICREHVAVNSRFLLRWHLSLPSKKHGHSLGVAKRNLLIGITPG
jgi:hypothetical protein